MCMYVCKRVMEGWVDGKDEWMKKKRGGGEEWMNGDEGNGWMDGWVGGWMDG